MREDKQRELPGYTGWAGRWEQLKRVRKEGKGAGYVGQREDAWSD